MTILAIDPGYDRCGVAILKKTGAKNEVLFSDCFTSPKTEAHADRLSSLQEKLAKLIKKWQPVEMAVEQLHLKYNRASAMKVSEARGVILAEAGRAGISVHEYSPATIKVAVAGYGKADKAQVISMVHRLVKCRTGALDDEYDAIAVGLTHLAIRKMAK